MEHCPSRPWVGVRRLASLSGPSCPGHTVYAPWGQAFEDPSPAEILPRPWADSVLPSAPAQLMCEKATAFRPLTWVAHARAQAGGARGPQPTHLSITSSAAIPLPVLSEASPSATPPRWAAGLGRRKTVQYFLQDSGVVAPVCVDVPEKEMSG